MESNQVLRITFRIVLANFKFFEKEKCCAPPKVIGRDALMFLLLKTALVHNLAEI